MKFFKQKEKSKNKLNNKGKTRKTRKKNFIKINISQYSLKRKARTNKRKNKQKNNKKYPEIVLEIISLPLFALSYYLYYLSLEKCFEGEDVCSKKWDWIYLKLFQLMISAIIILVLLILIFYNILSRLHLIHLIITFIYFYRFSHSSYFHDHGAFNLIGLFVVLFLSSLSLLFLKLIFVLFRIKNKYKLILIIVLLFLYNAQTNPTNCDDWPKGLNNTFIENDKNKYGCQIVFPKKCHYKIISYTQDFSLLSHIRCSNKKKNARNNILKFANSPYVNKNTMKFGFPLTNNEEGLKDGKDDNILKAYTKHNLIDMDNAIPSDLPKPEYIVDFSKDSYGELIIDLNYNLSLSLERKKSEINSIPYSENILILYIDSVSRQNAIRKLKRTLKFFEKFMPYNGGCNEKYPNENFHSFQFFKYHSFRGVTSGNFPKLFYGNDPKYAHDFVRITRYLKQNGYVTSYAIDYCQKDNARTNHNLSKDELYDHQLLLCDPNVIDFNSIIKRCLYGRLVSHHLYEYTNQFWRKYQNNRKFALVAMNDGHEGTLEVIKYTDDVIYDFLNSLFNDNLLKDTSIFLMSDHGCGMPSVYYLYDFYQIEFRLPMLFIIINDRKNVNYDKQYFNIQKNQQTFITAYDIYNTINNIIYGDNYAKIENKNNYHDTPKSPIGKSLFESIDAKKRKPKNYSPMVTNVCI